MQLNFRSNEYRLMYGLEWRTVYALARGLFWCSNSRSCINSSSRESKHYVISYATYESLNDDENNDPHSSTHPVYVLLTTSQSIADGVTITDNGDARTWNVISNSVDIDFVHGDIYGRS